MCDDAKIKRIYNIDDFPTSKAYILFYKLVDGSSISHLLDRRISSVSTEDLENEVQHNLIHNQKTLNKIATKRTRNLKLHKAKTTNGANIKRRVKKTIDKERENK